ncbi:unnamed protein product [Phytophthora fragariaefolia]|uniref:Unnamed protein product n=1 Tax=Phytophthora fragariaefolia TaxID=1490495 RepID=A0A9W7D0G4_9STRA|nr:unnamed protein product [Phytophthora fragariaefolia]
MNKHSFDHYAHNRTALEPEVVSTVNELRKAGAKKKNILRLKKQEDSGSTSAKRLKQWMVEFSEEPRNVGRIFVNSIRDKTKHMRQLFDRFPEVLMIDATHRTNSSKYKVSSIMTHDIFGKGQFVQHAVVQNERRTTFLTVLEEFKRNNPVWRRIHCTLIDKDFFRDFSSQGGFSRRTVVTLSISCISVRRYHVPTMGFRPGINSSCKKLSTCWFMRERSGSFKKYRGYLNYIMNIGRSAERVVSQLRSDDRQLGTGATELGVGNGQLEPIRSEMGAGRDELGEQDNCEVPKHPFDVYFAKNWDSCRPMWCAFERENAVTMGNNTNNRIEALWKQLKDLVNSFMGVDECVVSIMCYQDQEEKKFMDCLYKLSVVHNPKYDREMQFVSNLVSEHACELIYDQYIYATTRAKYKYCEPVPNMVLLQHDIDGEDALDEPRCEYSVTKRDWSCSCLFMSSRLLPCRHVFFLRKSLGCENIIPTQLLNPRWLMRSLRTTIDLPDIPGESFAVSRVIEESSPIWDSNRMKEYAKALNVLRSVAALFKHGDYGAISQATKQPEPVPDYNPTDICGGERSMQDETEELDSSASVDVNEERHEDEGLADANGNACADGHVMANQSDIQLAMSGLSNEIVLFPVNCNGNHWCSVMLDLNKRKVFICDSSASSYLVSLRVVAQKLITLLPIDVRPSTRLHVFEPGLGVQVDNYNCGVYVLLAFEIFCGASPFGYVNKQTLQCLRCRYLRLCAQA